jgi:predicted phage terminase large subunit-like protein
MAGDIWDLADHGKKIGKRLVRGGSGIKPYPGSAQATYERLYGPGGLAARGAGYLAAPHLGPIWSAFDRARAGERVRALVSMPPRWSKTECLLAGGVDRLWDDNEARIGWATYGGRLAQKKSARARTLATLSGIPISAESHSKTDWRTGIEGGMWATSVGGAITGEGFDLLILDDLLSGREDAESANIRDSTYDWLIADVLTRLEPEGSIIVCGTRYHEDDPIGRLSGGEDGDEWEYIKIPALDELDQSTWEARWNTERLREIRLTQGGLQGYEWTSKYQQNPRSEGERIFNDPALVTELPLAMRIGVGLDFAYTVKKSSDHSAAVVIGECGGRYYVLDVLRLKVPEAEFRRRAVELAKKWGAQFMCAYVAHTEKPNIDLIGYDFPTFGRVAVADKKTRALPTAAGWNTGRLMVRDGQPWTKAYLAEFRAFTGSDRQDDQVDATAAIYDAMFVGGAVDWAFVNQLAQIAPKAQSDWIGPHSGAGMH